MEEDSRIKLLVHSENKGIVASRNYGLVSAKGYFIANLDSDDIARKNRITQQVNFLKKNTDYVLLGSSCVEIDENGKKLRTIDRNLKNESIKSLLFFSNYFINSTIMMRADSAQKCGYEEGFAPAEDYHFFTQICKYGEVGNLKKALVKYRIHSTNISKLKKVEQQNAIKNILKLQIQNLNIEPSNLELTIHQNLVDGPFPNSIEEIKIIEKWLLKLLKMNKLYSVYPQKYFNYYLAFFYRRACTENKIGLKGYKFFKKSELWGFIKNDIKGNSISFVKSFVKKN